jgi:hypothetical protein
VKRRTAAERRLDAEEWKKVGAIDLQASDIACTLADAWLTYVKLGDAASKEAFCLALEMLERVTRSSAMRKVRP